MKDEDELLERKLLQFSKKAVDPAIAEEAVEMGGVRLMIQLIKRHDDNQSQAMKVLLALLRFLLVSVFSSPKCIYYGATQRSSRSLCGALRGCRDQRDLFGPTRLQCSLRLPQV